MPPSWSLAPRPPMVSASSHPLYGSNFQFAILPTPTVSICASIAITCLPCPMVPRIFPIGSISTLSKPTFSISCLMRKTTSFSCALSLGIAIMSRRNFVISGSYFFACSTIFAKSMSIPPQSITVIQNDTLYPQVSLRDPPSTLSRISEPRHGRTESRIQSGHFHSRPQRNCAFKSCLELYTRQGKTPVQLGFHTLIFKNIPVI